MLRAIDGKLEKDDIHTTIVIDNAHRGDSGHLLSIINATPNLRYILLCQPSLTVSELVANLGIAAESLGGWTTDTIAADTADAGCKPTAKSVQNLLDLTAGLPPLRSKRSADECLENMEAISTPSAKNSKGRPIRLRPRREIILSPENLRWLS